MADNRPQPSKRSAPETGVDRAAQQQTVIRPTRPESQPVASLMAEAERIMGVKPLTGRLRPLPGY